MTPFPPNELNNLRLQIRAIETRNEEIKRISETFSPEQKIIYQMGVLYQCSLDISSTMRNFAFELEKLEGMVEGEKI